MLVSPGCFAGNCFICNEETPYFAKDMGLGICPLHFGLIPWKRYLLHRCVQLYIPSNIFCSLGYNINTKKIDQAETHDAVCLFFEDSQTFTRYMTPNKSYPIYLLFAPDGKIKVRLFIRCYPSTSIITDHHTHYIDVPLNEVNVTVNTTLVNLEVFLKENFSSCTPIITKQSYLLFPVYVRNFFNNHPIVKDISLSLESLTVANMFRVSGFCDTVLYDLPNNIFEIIYSVDPLLLKYNDADATVDVTISKTRPKYEEPSIVVLKEYKSI